MECLKFWGTKDQNPESKMSEKQKGAIQKFLNVFKHMKIHSTLSVEV